MKTKLVLCAIALCSIIALNGCKPSDEKLKQAVTTALNAMPASISSEVKKGEVTLSGIVDSEEAKAEIGKAISAIKGIKSIVNNIEVKKPEPVINPDDVLKSTITSALSAGGDAFKNVIATVQNGEVTLTGAIQKANLQKVMQIVNEAYPGKVNNQLTIEK